MIPQIIGAAILGTLVILWARRASGAPATIGGVDLSALVPAGSGGGGGGGPVEQWRPLVAAINAADHGGWFNEADVLAIIEIESSGRPNAYRGEPRIGDASYGLMQVLYSTARDRGYAGPPEGLFDPETNIRIGMAHLRWSYEFLARKNNGAPSADAWIGSYNGGVGNALKGYVPLAYVRKWRAARGGYA